MSEKRVFKHIAKLVKEKRQASEKRYSQSELSTELGYKNGQFISNVERGKCAIPLKMLAKTCEVLGISADEMKDAMVKDYEATVSAHLTATETATIDTETTTTTVTETASVAPVSTDSVAETSVDSASSSKIGGW